MVFVFEMSCFNPLPAWRGSINSKSGKRSIVFNRQSSKVFGSEMSLPCGRCDGCLLDRSLSWALRCVHESELYCRNCFITLTFDDKHLPEDGCIDVRHLQLFLKRLRKRFSDVKFRFFACGEYGSNFGRPHYHMCLFNLDFDDKVLYSIRNENRLYVSQTLTDVWGQGFAVIGDMTFDSAAYVARYVLKKVGGEDAVDHYVDKDSGFIRHREFITMSRGGRGKGLGGIGKPWYDKYKGDLFPHGYAVVKGAKVAVPKFYDSLYEHEDPVGFGDLKARRKARIDHLVPLVDRLAGKSDFVRDSTPDRLAVREFCKKSAIKSLVRPLEDSHVY